MAFPINPSPGDTYTDDYGTVWVYAGSVNGWYRQTVIPGNETTYTTGDSGGGGSATAAGAAGEIQYTDGTNLAASADLSWDDTAKLLDVGGDITLDDGGTYSTTLQTVTPTANRTISFPDATGTVALVAGSNQAVQYNSAGANAGDSGLLYDATTGSLTVGGKTVTTAAPVINLSQTWNNAATTFTGLKLNVTNTASAAGSNLLDLQVNGTSQFRVGSSGGVVSAGSITAPGNGFGGISLGPGTAYGASQLNVSSNFGLLTDNGTPAFGWDGSLAYLPGGQIGFGTSIFTGNIDIYLARDAANTLAQRNGTNAQTFRLYNTYTDASNYERGFLQWNSNVLEIGSEGAGTGSEQPVRITAATLKLPNLPTYADNAAATTGGLVAGDVYKTATGELRITV